MFQRIVVAYDGSAQAESAFDHALELAARLSAQLLVVSVVRPPEPATRIELEAILDAARQHFEEAFVRLRERAASRRVALKAETAVGHPAEQIVAFAEQDGADLIVMGRRGKTAFARLMLGSVSERVLRYAHCPVLVVR